MLPLALSVLAGAALSAQAFVNGRLAGTTGSAELAGLGCSVVGAASSLAIARATGGLRTAKARWRDGCRPRAWHLAGGFLVALPIIVSAEGVGRLGVALLTVALVCGQTIGSLVIDRVGLSPGGRRPVTVPRVAGACIALAAVALPVADGPRHTAVGLLWLAVLAGASIAVIQASTGHLAMTFGDPLVASGIIFTTAAVSTLAAWVSLKGASAPGGLAAPPVQWLAGGLVGTALTVVIARVVSSLGSLGLTLTLVAGQTVGALLLDLVAPVAGRAVTGLTLCGLVLVFCAVIVGNLRPAAPLRSSAG